MSNRIAIKELEQAIAAGRRIAVGADQVIWSYAKTNKGWVRVRTELSSPEAAERRLVECADEGALIFDAKASGDTSAVLKWFDEVLHARVSDLKMGFIFCGDGNNQEPAIAVCAHVLQGAPRVSTKCLFPTQASTVKRIVQNVLPRRVSGTSESFAIPAICNTRTGVPVTDLGVVIANDGNH